MRRIFILLVVISLTYNSIGQNIDTIWYNNKWEKTNNSKEHYYYSIVKYDQIKNIYKVNDFFPDGKIQMSGEYANIEPKVKNGNFTWYYTNGNKKLFNLYRNDTLLIFEKYDETGKLVEKILKKEYTDGLSDSEKSKLGIKKNEFPAEFPGGDEKLLSYINKNIHYPKEAIEQKIEGRVWVRFTVTKKGKLINVTAPYNSNPILEREAIRVVSLMPKWKPAKNQGHLVDELHTIPISFKLQ